MTQYLCTVCGYVYNEESPCTGVFFEEINGELSEGVIDSSTNDQLFAEEVEGVVTEGIMEREDQCSDLDVLPGTKWKDIPDSFLCPRCKAAKDKFRKITR